MPQAPVPANPRPQGGGSDFGLSDIAAWLSPAYALTQGKSPFAGGLLGMAIPGLGGTPEQQSAPFPFGGIGSLMQPSAMSPYSQQGQDRFPDRPGVNRAQQLPQNPSGLMSLLGPLAGILPGGIGR